MAMSTVLSSSHSASPSIEQIAAGTRRLLSWFAAVCPAETVRRFVMQKLVQSVLSVQQQATQTFPK